VLRQPVVRATAQCHGKGVCGSAAADSEVLPAEEHMSEWGERASGTIRYAGPEQVVDRVGARAGRQAGHVAIAKVPDYANPVIQVPCGRPAKTLAVCPPPG